MSDFSINFNNPSFYGKKLEEIAEKIAQEHNEEKEEEVKNKSKTDNPINENKNTCLETIFNEINKLNGNNSIFDNIDSDTDEILSIEEILDFNEKDSKEKEVITEDLKYIFSNLDANEDGMLNQKELDALNSNIKDNENVNSIKKLMVLMGLNIEESAKKLIQKDIDKSYQQIYGTAETPETESAPPSVSSSGSSGSNGGSSGSSSSTNIKTVEDYNEAIKQKEEEKTKLKEKSTNEVTKLEEKIQKELIDSGVTEEKLSEYNEKKTQLDAQIQTQDTLINEKVAYIQDQNAQLSGIDSTIKAYESQITNLQTTKQNGDINDAERNARIESKISNLNTAIANEKNKIPTIKAEIEKAEQEKQEAENKKTILETEKDELLNALIPENSEKSAEIKTKIDELKEQIKATKQKEQSDISAIDKEIQVLKNEKNSLERKEDSNKIIDENKESNFDANGKRIGTRKWPETEEDYLQYGLKTPEAIKRFEMCDQKLKEAYIDLSDWCREQGIYLQVNASFRTYEDQVALYDGGNNNLASAPGTSPHEKGLAIDLRPYKLDMTTSLSQSMSTYQKMGEYWENILGHEWHGNRASKTEKWHFEIKR